MADTKTRALDMLSTAALDHYTPHMICVPTDKWVEAFSVAGSLEAPPPADAALAEVSDSVLLKAYTTASAGEILAHSWRPIFLRHARIGIAAALRARQEVAVPEGMVLVDASLIDDEWMAAAMRDAGIVRAVGAPPETIIRAAISGYLLAASGRQDGA